MNTFQKRITWRVLGIHAAVIVVVWLFAVMPRCFTPKPKEIVTIVVVGDPAPEVSVDPGANMDDPEPPAPEPPPERIPEPVKEKPVPIKKKPEPIKKKPDPVKKPKQRLARPEDIKIGPKVKSTPQKPTVSSADIRNAMEGITQSSTPTTGTPSQFAAYDAQVFRIFYGAWTRPGAPGARPAKVRILVSKSGRITGRTLIQTSGDSSFDQSVMAAVRSVSVLPKPPAGYPDNFVVRFSIID